MLIIGLIAGVALGVLVMALLYAAKDPFDVECCDGNCTQGQHCPMRRDR